MLRPHAELVRRMEAQHEVLAKRSGWARRLLGRWREAPAAQIGAELATSLSLLGVQLVKHLDDEEAHILPRARASTWPERSGTSSATSPLTSSRAARPVMLGQL